MLVLQKLKQYTTKLVNPKHYRDEQQFLINSIKVFSYYIYPYFAIKVVTIKIFRHEDIFNYINDGESAKVTISYSTKRRDVKIIMSNIFEIHVVIR